jgi:hypothetical protein
VVGLLMDMVWRLTMGMSLLLLKVGVLLVLWRRRLLRLGWLLRLLGWCRMRVRVLRRMRRWLLGSRGWGRWWVRRVTRHAHGWARVIVAVSLMHIHNITLTWVWGRVIPRVAMRILPWLLGIGLPMR